MKKLVLIDGNALMHRAYHAVKFAPLLDGQPVGMVFGFSSMLINIIDHYQPHLLVTAFDTKEKTFRHEMDKNYKAHRQKADDEFYAQIPYIYECLGDFDVPVLKKPGFEADDIVGTLAVQGEQLGFEVLIVSGDLDFLQLVSDRVKVAKIHGRVQDSPLYGPEETVARYGISPDQIVDFKALVGDSSDNYKGVPGIGPKGASKLLQTYKTLEGLYAHLSDLAPKMSEKLSLNKDSALHCQKLAQINLDVELDFSLSEVGEYKTNLEKARVFLEKFRFPSLVNRLEKVVYGHSSKPTPAQKKSTKKTDKCESQLSLF